MKRITFLTKITALMAVVALAGTAIAQPTAPSLVTQQLRISTTAGGNWINLRAGNGATNSDANPYFLDNAPQPPVAAESYALWLDGSNHIRQSIKFTSAAGPYLGGVGGPGYLYRVNAAGTGTEWVVPSDLTTANNGLVVDNTTTPGTTIVQLGATATATNTIAVPRFVSQAAGGSLTFDGVGALNFGAGTAVMNVTIDPSATGFLAMNNLPGAVAPAATDKFVYLDASNHANTRLLSGLVDANNGLVIDATAVVPTVQLGALATGTNTIAAPRFVSQAVGGALTFDGTGALNLGSGATTMNVTIDPGAAGALTLNNLPTSVLATDLVVLIDATSKAARTRTLSSLVDANNGLFLDVSGATPTVQLGAAASGTNPLLVPRFVGIGGQSLTFDGAGAFNVGAGTAVLNITLDPSATGFVRMNNIPASVTPLATDRFTFLDATNNVNTRLLSSLVDGNNGIEIDLTSTPGTAIVQLGSTAAADVSSALSVDRFINMNSHAISFEQNGTVNLGTATSNMSVNVNTGTSNMTITGANLASPVAATPAASDFHNIAYVESTTNVVHTITAANMARNDIPTDYVAIDPATGNFVKAISPTAGIWRGRTAWSAWNQTGIGPGVGTFVAGAVVTATIENNGSQGTVALQVTNVAAGTGTFNIQAADNPPAAGSFINWVIMNP